MGSCEGSPPSQGFRVQWAHIRPGGRQPMRELPTSFTKFREQFPKIAAKYDELGTAAHESGPLDQKTRELVKLGIAIGARAEGAVHSHARRALDAGASHDEIMHVLALAVTSIGFAPTVAAYTWINDQLKSR